MAEHLPIHGPLRIVRRDGDVGERPALVIQPADPTVLAMVVGRLAHDLTIDLPLPKKETDDGPARARFVMDGGPVDLIHDGDRLLIRFSDENNRDQVLNLMRRLMD